MSKVNTSQTSNSKSAPQKTPDNSKKAPVKKAFNPADYEKLNLPREEIIEIK
jgi:hypothetical protein